MMRAHFACRHVDDLCSFGPYFSVSMITFFHMMILLLLGRFLIFFVRTEMNLLLVVVGLSKFEQHFKLTVNWLYRLRCQLFRLICEINLCEYLCRFFYVGKFI